MKRIVHRRGKKRRRWGGRQYNVRDIPVSQVGRILTGVRPPECAYCGGSATVVGKLTVDHIVPKALGGSDLPPNLTLACLRCNHAKADMTVAEFFGL